MSKFESIDIKEFKAKASSGDYVVLDVRTPGETAQGKLFEDALELDVYSPDFMSKLNKLDKGAKYLIYCRSGSRTKFVLDLMEKLDFIEAHDLRGGILSS